MPRMTSYRDLILELLGPWERLGVGRGKSTTYYGLADSERGPGWLHAIFDPVYAEAMEDFCSLSPWFRRYAYKELLVSLNGAHLFSGALDLHGLHIGGPSSASFSDARIPYDLMRIHYDASGFATKYDGLIFGSSTLDTPSLSYLECASGSVKAILDVSGEQTNEWPSLDSFLIAEIDRLSKAFGSDGEYLGSQAN